MAGAPKLIILSQQFRGRTFELTKDLYTVGRVDERDICIKDPTISTYHCALIKEGNGYIIKDQGSTNGTRINNAPVTEQLLQNSDIIQVGGVELLYDCADKTVTTVIQQTVTGIDINAAKDNEATKEFGRMGFSEKKRGDSAQKVLLGVIILLVILVAALIIFLVVTMSGNGSKEAASAVGTIANGITHLLC